MKTDLAQMLWPRAAVLAPCASTQYEFEDDVESLVDILPRVLLFNDDHHTFDEVIAQVMKATACSGAHAEGIALEVHTQGKAMVFEGELYQCLRVSSVLEEIALHTQVLT